MYSLPLQYLSFNQYSCFFFLKLFFYYLNVFAYYFIHYNEECKEQRSLVWVALKNFLKQKTLGITEEVKKAKQNLETERKSLKIVHKKVREMWQEERWKEVNEAKDMCQWWAAINKYRPKKRPRTSREIKERTSREHFDRLLNGEQEEKRSSNRPVDSERVVL